MDDYVRRLRPKVSKRSGKSECTGKQEMKVATSKAADTSQGTAMKGEP